MTTLAAKMANAAGRPAGFDYIRLVLATSVIAWHSINLVGSKSDAIVLWTGPARSLVGLILPLFFSLSGFLVTGSLERNKSLISFLGLRAIRLLPALATEISLSALILGPLLTLYPLPTYFRDWEFIHYFLNIFGLIHYHLPGVFTRNPYGDAVNGQLWTIPVELECYVTIAILAVIGVAARTRLLITALLVVQLLVPALVFISRQPMTTAFSGHILVGCFLAGVAFYKLRTIVPMKFSIFMLASILMEVGLFAPQGYYLISVPAAYMVTYLGSLNPRRTWIVRSGDYSYGLYLYGFPLQQAFESLGAWTHNALLNFGVAYPVAFLVAFASWHRIEKPALLLKGRISKTEEWILRAPPLNWHSQHVFRRRTS